MLELDYWSAAQQWSAQPSSTLPPRAIQSVDLRQADAMLMEKAFPDSLFLGCLLSDRAAGHIVQTSGGVGGLARV